MVLNNINNMDNFENEIFIIIDINCYKSIWMIYSNIIGNKGCLDFLFINDQYPFPSYLSATQTTCTCTANKISSILIPAYSHSTFLKLHLKIVLLLEPIEILNTITYTIMLLLLFTTSYASDSATSTISF